LAARTLAEGLALAAERVFCCEDADAGIATHPLYASMPDVIDELRSTRLSRLTLVEDAPPSLSDLTLTSLSNLPLGLTFSVAKNKSIGIFWGNRTPRKDCVRSKLGLKS
jgi:hypothetical protein